MTACTRSLKGRWEFISLSFTAWGLAGHQLGGGEQLLVHCLLYFFSPKVLSPPFPLSNKFYSNTRVQVCGFLFFFFFKGVEWENSVVLSPPARLNHNIHTSETQESKEQFLSNSLRPSDCKGHYLSKVLQYIFQLMSEPPKHQNSLSNPQNTPSYNDGLSI